MTNPFFDQLILNSPYARPSRYRELDSAGQPTQVVALAFLTQAAPPRR
jgi:type III restriction enzyme